jgi:hypothetical protein
VLSVAGRARVPSNRPLASRPTDLLRTFRRTGLVIVSRYCACRRRWR